jgi:DNA-directed RNA polymerase subunit RPC12/RpoP
MARAYRECPACGQRALSIATRCPRCGHELLTQPVRQRALGDGRPERLRPLVALTLVLLVTAGLVALFLPRTAAPSPAPAVTTDEPAEPPVALDTAYAAASLVRSDSAPSAEAVPRLARTWTKVHDRRSVRADVVAVLLPGDTVLADSLRGGWWRVALEGQVIGYVYRRTLLGD